MPFKGFSIFRSGGHFVQQSETIFAILVESHKEHFSDTILKLGHTRIYHLKVFFYF